MEDAMRPGFMSGFVARTVSIMVSSNGGPETCTTCESMCKLCILYYGPSQDDLICAPTYLESRTLQLPFYLGLSTHY